MAELLINVGTGCTVCGFLASISSKKWLSEASNSRLTPDGRLWKSGYVVMMDFMAASPSFSQRLLSESATQHSIENDSCFENCHDSFVILPEPSIRGVSPVLSSFVGWPVDAVQLPESRHSSQSQSKNYYYLKNKFHERLQLEFLASNSDDTTSCAFKQVARPSVRMGEARCSPLGHISYCILESKNYLQACHNSLDLHKFGRIIPY
jgi:hypothetical protein